MAMIRTQVYIPEDLHRELKLLALAQNTNFSQLIRKGANWVVKKTKKRKKKFDPWKDFIGKGKRGDPKNLSGKIDYYLYDKPYKTIKKK